MAVLLSDPQLDEGLLRYSTTLSRRMQQSLTGIVREGGFNPIVQEEAGFSLKQVPALSPHEISAALKQLKIDLLFVSTSNAALIEDLNMNFVVYPVPQDA
jgi:hypothetical protein